MGSFGRFSVDEYLQESQLSLQRTIASRRFRDAICASTRLCIDALLNGGKLLLCGNGGSAADAQHIAGEFVSRFHFNRPGLPALALTVDSSVLTAIGNDYGYEQVFSRQVQALGRAGDALIVISTSGSSPNILAAVEEARRLSLKVISMTGLRGFELAAKSDEAIIVESQSTPLIQQAHIVAAHAICAAVEASLFAEYNLDR